MESRDNVLKKLAHIFLILFFILEIIGGIIKSSSNNSKVFSIFIFAGIASAFIWYILGNDKSKKCDT